MKFRDLLRKDTFQTILTSLLCVILGLFVGFIILLMIKPSEAHKNFWVMTLNFLKVDIPNEKVAKIMRINYLASSIVKFTPLLVCGLSILFAYKAGMFNIGCSGQYTLGVLATILCGVVWKLPWWICIIVAIIFATLWGVIVGVLKAFLSINEVISGIMLNWIGLYLTNLIIKNSSAWDSVKFETYAMPEASKIPSLGIDKLFNNNAYINIGFIIAILIAIILLIVLNKTTFGYELKATGANKDASKYAGMKEKRNIIVTLAISGGLAGLGAALFYLTGLAPWYCPTSVPDMGFNGISAAFLGGLSPVGTIISSFFITSLAEGGARLNHDYYNPEISSVITALIIYLCAFVFFMKEKINKWLLKKDREDALKATEDKGGNK